MKDLLKALNNHLYMLLVLSPFLLTLLLTKYLQDLPTFFHESAVARLSTDSSDIVELVKNVYLVSILWLPCGSHVKVAHPSRLVFHCVRVGRDKGLSLSTFCLDLSRDGALSIFITRDAMFHCFHYGIRVFTVWLTWLS